MDYELASLLDRGKAYAIDLLIRVAAVVIIGVVLFFVAGVAGLASLGLWLVIYFAVEWGYYVFCESMMSGQSPGKRLFELRVVRVEGHPIGFFDSAIRNLLRAADQLPFSYAIGAISVMASGRFQRLGDLAAGTVVVREQRAYYGAQLPKIDPSLFRSDSRVVLSNRERRLLQEFVVRKDRLHPERREQLAEILAGHYRQRFGFDAGDTASETLVRLFASAARESQA